LLSSYLGPNPPPPVQLSDDALPISSCLLFLLCTCSPTLAIRRTRLDPNHMIAKKQSYSFLYPSLYCFMVYCTVYSPLTLCCMFTHATLDTVYWSSPPQPTLAEITTCTFPNCPSPFSLMPFPWQTCNELFLQQESQKDDLIFVSMPLFLCGVKDPNCPGTEPTERLKPLTRPWSSG
jgi:hypothetical protein